MKDIQENKEQKDSKAFKIFAVLVMLICATIYSVGYYMGQEIPDGQAEELIRLLKEDEAYNKKSVYWDGITVKIIDDEQDSIEVSDGRSWGMNEEVANNDVYSLALFAEHDYFKVADTKSHLLLDGNDYFIEIKKIDSFDEKEEQLDSDRSLIVLDAEEYNLKQTDRYEKHKLYGGLQGYNGKVYAGYTLIMRDSITETDWELKGYNIGNMENNKAINVFNNFRLHF